MKVDCPQKPVDATGCGRRESLVRGSVEVGVSGLLQLVSVVECFWKSDAGVAVVREWVYMQICQSM